MNFRRNRGPVPKSVIEQLYYVLTDRLKAANCIIQPLPAVDTSLSPMYNTVRFCLSSWLRWGGSM